ncbi:MAG: BACON domain-containing protein [Alistipes sp.]|nr:BACON domain-containing protein [Alistipes sp.]
MKKLFFLLTLSLLAFTACEKSQKEVDNAVLNITSGELLNFEATGGKGTITYTLENAKKNALPTATSGAEWISDITVAQDITFNVAATDTSDERSAVIVVAYGEQSYTIHIRQVGDPYADWVVDVEFVATALNGEYYGTAYSTDPNYFAILSKNGTTGWSDLYVDTYYRFDIYSKTATDSNAPVLPLGTYTLDEYSVGEGDTFGEFYSVRMETFQSGQYQETKIEDGVIYITENKFEALLKMSDGKVHRVIYEGSLALGYIAVPEPDYYSTLTEDYNFNHDNGVLRINYYGDYYGVGAANWVVSMVLPGAKVNGDYFSIDLVANTDEYNVSSIFGTYTCAADESKVAKNTFIAGDYQDGKFQYSWYFVCVDDTFGSDDIAPLTDGTITISEVDGKYVVTYDCMDDNGHKIQGTYTCSTLEMYDSTQQ